MSEINQEHLVELAFALANGERLTAPQESLAKSLAANPALAALVEEYVRVIGVLRSAYARETDPAIDAHLDDETLAAYVDGVLDEGEQERVERVLAGSAYWFRQYVSLKEVLREVEDGLGLARFAIQIVRRGLSWVAHPEIGFEFRPVASPAMLGEDAGVQSIAWSQRTSSMSLEGTFQYHEPDSVDVAVCLRTVEGAPLTCRLSLYRRERLVESRPHDGVAPAYFMLLRPDVYTLAVELEAGSVERFELEVRGA